MEQTTAKLVGMWKLVSASSTSWKRGSKRDPYGSHVPD